MTRRTLERSDLPSTEPNTMINNGGSLSILVSHIRTKARDKGPESGITPFVLQNIPQKQTVAQ